MDLSLKDVLLILAQTHHFNITPVRPPFEELKDFDNGLRRTIIPELDFPLLGRYLLANSRPDTFILTKDELDCHYALFPLPEEGGTVYLCGPVARTSMSDSLRRRVRARFGDAGVQDFAHYYHSLPLDDGTRILLTMIRLYEAAHPERKLECVEDWSFFPPTFGLPVAQERSRPDLNQLQEQFLVEKHRLEGQLIGAVSNGDSRGAIAILTDLEQYFTVRSPSMSISEHRNNLIGVNALCRLAVSHCQSVHPAYVEKLYESYLEKADYISDPAEMGRVAGQMVSAYCGCVQNHSLNQYSPPVQQVLNYIHLHVEENLSLKFFSRMCSFSPSYLSDLFHKETGVTLTDYINRYRVEQAALALQYTDLTIAKIGENVGFLDENYFTRIFKKIKGVPPSVYRKNNPSLLP